MTDNIQESFSGTRIAGTIAAGALDEVAKIIKPGITTNQIDVLCFPLPAPDSLCLCVPSAGCQF